MIKSLLNLYYQKPVFYDLVLAFLGCLIMFVLKQKELLDQISEERILSSVTEISNVCFTTAGFVLTFITLIVSFKESSATNHSNEIPEKKIFQVFFSSSLYAETLRQLKNFFKSLVILAFTGYLIKTALPSSFIHYAFYFNITSLIILLTTLFRSLLIIMNILKLQNLETEE